MVVVTQAELELLLHGVGGKYPALYFRDGVGYGTDGFRMVEVVLEMGGDGEFAADIPETVEALNFIMPNPGIPVVNLDAALGADLQMAVAARFDPVALSGFPCDGFSIEFRTQRQGVYKCRPVRPRNGLVFNVWIRSLE